VTSHKTDDFATCRRPSFVCVAWQHCCNSKMATWVGVGGDRQFRVVSVTSDRKLPMTARLKSRKAFRDSCCDYAIHGLKPKLVSLRAQNLTPFYEQRIYCGLFTMRLLCPTDTVS